MISFQFDRQSVFDKLIDKYAGPLTSEQKNQITDIVKENYIEVWQTKGASIGSPWKEGVDLVDTGALRQEMRSARGLKIYNSSMVITSSRPYSSFVNKRYRFMDLSSTTLRRIAQVYSRQSIIR